MKVSKPEKFDINKFLNNRVSKYGFNTLNVGESVFLTPETQEEAIKMRSRVSSDIVKQKKRFGIVLRSTMTDGGMRVFRIA